MSENLKTPEESITIADRRSFPRIQVRSLAYIELDDGNGGLILNIGEGGVAVQTAELLMGDFFGKIRFRLPKAQNWIQTTGKIAWQGRSRKEAGIKFMDLPGDAQRQIHDWIYSAAFSPSLLTEKGRFKIMWEAEPSKPESGSPASVARAVPSEFDAIFPSEQSLPLAPVSNVQGAHSVNAAADAITRGGPANSESGGNPESPADETDMEIPLGGVEAGLSSTESPPQTASKEWPGEIPLPPPRSPVDERRYSSPFAAIDAPANPASKRAYGTPFSEYEEEVAGAQPRSRKTQILTGVLCFAAGLVLALLIVVGPSGLKNRLFQYFKASVASVVNSSRESAPPSPSTPSPSKVTDYSTQQPPMAAPAAPGPQQQESPPPPKGDSAAANAPAEPNERGSVNAPESAESSALRPSPASHPVENEPSGPQSAPPANQVLASPGRENPSQDERTLDAYVQPARKEPVSPVVNEPQTAENVQAPATTQPMASPPAPPAPVSREPEIPVGTVAISSHFHSVRNAPVSDPEAPAPILRVGQLASIRQPDYPPEAAKRRIEGVVRLRAAVGQNGIVESVELVSGPPGLVAAAIDAVRDWRYDQTLLDERPVESLEDIAVVFRLANSTPSPR